MIKSLKSLLQNSFVVGPGYTASFPLPYTSLSSPRTPSDGARSPRAPETPSSPDGHSVTVYCLLSVLTYDTLQVFVMCTSVNFYMCVFSADNEHVHHPPHTHTHFFDHIVYNLSSLPPYKSQATVHLLSAAVVSLHFLGCYINE